MAYFSRLDGLFAVIKPVNLSSAETCNRIRHDLKKELLSDFSKLLIKRLKIGHGGTLDRDATGVLPIALGSSCHLLNSLLHADKHYICHAQLGFETDTGLASGAVVERLPFEHVTKDSLEKTITGFVGSINQQPPIYSALKFKGRRLSDYAYAGEPVPLSKLVPRPVTVHNIICTDFRPPYFTLDIQCGSGFYVRSLVRDLGIAMKSCANVLELERIAHGEITKEMCIPAYQWSIDAVLVAIEQFKSIPSKH